MITAYTDYPVCIGYTGDTILVTVVTWDGNKYCEVLHQGQLYAIKSRYLYLDVRLRNRLPFFELDKLPLLGRYTPNLINIGSINSILDT